MDADSKRWTVRYLNSLVGHTIDRVGVTDDGFPFFKLDDGTVVEVSRDSEGNGPGFLFGLPEPKSTKWVK
jgi:hypothetical protein